MADEKGPGRQWEKAPGYCSYRWAVSSVGFLGFIFVYAFRINLSLAIVCMVRSTNSSGNHSEFEPQYGGEEVIANSSDQCIEEMATGRTPNRGEFDWDKQLQSRLLAAFFYGYIITPIPGGWLARKVGCRRVLGVGMALCTLSTVLVPVCARLNVYLVFALRVIAGLSSGVSFPAMHCLWGRWAPPLERSKLMALCYSGSSLGNIVTLTFSGMLCANGFDNGWGSIFYTLGAASIVWLCLWFYVVYDTPRDHPRISETELEYIEESIGDNAAISDRGRRTPWLAMLKSPALWACVTAHFCNNWTNYTLLTSLPTYMKEVLKFDIKQNGFLSSVPYVCQLISSVVSGQVADFLREKRILTTRSTRRVMQVTAFLGAAVFLVATGFVSCENRMLAVALLSLAVTFKGLERGGYMANHVDFGPRFAGELYGITNTVATIPGMVTPLVSGALTPNKTQEEWRMVFFLCAGVATFGAVVFGTLVRGEVQEWALLTKPQCLEITQSDTHPTLLWKEKDSNNKNI